MPIAPRSRWQAALPWAVLVSGFVLGLFYDWFAIADRYAVFLYGHATANLPTAQPFDAATSSRYWMAGLVASGAVLCAYPLALAGASRAAALCGRNFAPPPAGLVWALCAGPLIVGIPAITLTVNAPTLPPALAAAATAATLAGLGLALLPGTWAVHRPADLAWLATDGLGLAPALLLVRAIELPGRGLSVSVPVAWGFAVGGSLAGLAWLGAMTALRAWRRRPPPGAAALLLAGLAISYLLMPLVHHLAATPPGFRYITSASNFFALAPGVQALALGVAATLGWAVTRPPDRHPPRPAAGRCRARLPARQLLTPAARSISGPGSPSPRDPVTPEQDRSLRFVRPSRTAT